MCLNYQSDLCGREEGEAVFPRVGRGLTCFGCCLHSLLPVFSLRQWQGSCPKGSTHRPKWTEYSSESKEKRKKKSVFEKTHSGRQCRGCFVSLRSGRQAEGPRLFFFCCTRSRLKTETGRARFRETGKTDARKRPTSAASPQRSLLKAESRLAATMESLLRSPMKLVLLTGTWARPPSVVAAGVRRAGSK